MTQSPPPPGWYPDQHNPALERWWGGDSWTGATRPTGAAPSAEPTAAKGFGHWGVIGLLLAMIGLAIVLFTNVTVLSGMDQVTFGAILAGAGAVVTLITRRSVAIQVVCVLLAAGAIAGAVYDQHQVDQKRNELQQIFNSP